MLILLDFSIFGFQGTIVSLCEPLEVYVVNLTFNVSLTRLSEFIREVQLSVPFLTVLPVMKKQNFFYSFITAKTYLFFKGIWQPPALPYRLQHSTIGRLGLNHRVRDENGCGP